MADYYKSQPCIGFGATTGVCRNPSSEVRANGLCQVCDDARIKHIDKRMMELKEMFGL